MTPPFIIDEHGDVSLYETAEIAGRALEPIDIENNEYVGYDSEGFVLAFVCHGPSVHISGRVSNHPEPEKLIAVLRSFWERAAQTPWPVTASVGQAVAQSCKRFGYCE